MDRCVIIGGADIKCYEEIRKELRPEDFLIYCDSGLKHRESLGAEPDLIVGDFDSHENPHLNAETIVLPTVKDDTDTAYAVKEAVKRGFREVCMIGVTGGRADHTLVNLFLLYKMDSLGVKAQILDDYSEMEVISDKTALIEDSYPFFSLINMTGTAKGVSIRNAKYELEDAQIGSEDQYATSNEVLPGKRAEVSVKEGRLLLIKVKRE